MAVTPLLTSVVGLSFLSRAALLDDSGLSHPQKAQLHILKIHSRPVALVKLVCGLLHLRTK